MHVRASCPVGRAPPDTGSSPETAPLVAAHLLPASNHEAAPPPSQTPPRPLCLTLLLLSHRGKAVAASVDQSRRRWGSRAHPPKHQCDALRMAKTHLITAATSFPHSIPGVPSPLLSHPHSHLRCPPTRLRNTRRRSSSIGGDMCSLRVPTPPEGLPPCTPAITPPCHVGSLPEQQAETRPGP
jgi:hypothetical protein